MRIYGTETHVDPAEVAAVGRLSHETRAHYRDDWYYFHITMKSGAVVKADGRSESFVRRGKEELLIELENRE